MTRLALDPSPGADWMEILARPTRDAFAMAFCAEPVLEALVVWGPVIGVPAIHAFLGVARDLYAEISFTMETRRAARACLEWEGSFAGRPVSGATILGYDAHGKIERIRLYHYPLEQLAAFSAAIQCCLAERVTAEPLRQAGASLDRASMLRSSNERLS